MISSAGPEDTQRMSAAGFEETDLSYATEEKDEFDEDEAENDCEGFISSDLIWAKFLISYMKTWQYFIFVDEIVYTMYIVPTYFDI